MGKCDFTFLVGLAFLLLVMADEEEEEEEGEHPNLLRLPAGDVGKSILRHVSTADHNAEIFALEKQEPDNSDTGRKRMGCGTVAVVPIISVP